MIDYIGVKYMAGGKSKEEGFDCYTFVRHYMDKQFGIDMIDVNVEIGRKISFSLNLPKFIDWQETKEPYEGCIVLLGIETIEHCGVYLKGGVLHCIHNHGVVWTPINKLEQLFGYRILQYYEHSTII